ncbi:DUF4179 domain-containing protein [Brevibacillus ginsengisoli]|uniref:DUF4179 domain-containing protein n=1 Tax=Brevibacillus ginsengisoli TaxID=363854 RepID=UPI003CF77F9E
MVNQLPNAKQPSNEPTFDVHQFKAKLQNKLANSAPLVSSRSIPRLKIALLATTAIVVIGGSVVSYVSPTFAQWVSSFLNYRISDQGLEEAVKMGYNQPKEIRVTDQGITLVIPEVLADTNRLILSYYVEREDGTRSVDYLDSHGKLYVTSETGELLAKNITSFSRGYDFGYFQFNLSKVTDQVVIHVEIPEIDSIDYPDKKGKWNVTVPVDMKEAISATKQIPINKQLTTKQGVMVDLKDIVYSPSAVRLNLTTTRTPEARQRIQDDLKRIHANKYDKQSLESSYYYYKIVDQKGNVLVKTGDVEESVNALPSSHTIDPKDPYSTTDQEVFVPVKGEKLRFILDQLVIVETADLQFELTQQNLKTGEMTKEYEGNTFTVKNLTMQKTKNQTMMPMIEVTGKMKGGYNCQWTLVDEHGKQYESVIQTQDDEDISLVKVGGVYVDRDKRWDLRQRLSFPDLKTITGNYTLKLKTIPRWYPMNWEVPLPSES